MDDSIDYFKNIISEYEEMLPAINEELNFYKVEYHGLKREMMNLDKENKLLSMRLEDSFRNKTDSIDLRRRYSENDMVDNLKSQLEISVKEKESINSLWQNSMKRIDNLETELRVYTYTSESETSKTNNNLKTVYDKQIKKLQKEIKMSNIKLMEAVKLSQKTLDTKKKELEKVLDKQSETIKVVQNMEKEINDLQDKHKQVESMKDSLEKGLETKNKIIADLKIEAYNAKMKVAEACHVIEVAMIEKDAAIKREQDAKAEVSKLTQTLDEIITETEEKVKNEVRQVKQEYKNKMNRFEVELRRSQEELELRTMDLEKRSTICKELEIEIDRMRKTNCSFQNSTSSEKAILSKKIEEIYDKLLTSEKSNIELITENESLKDNLNHYSRTHEIKLNCKEKEKRLLETKICNLQNELEMSNSKLLQVAMRVEDLNGKVVKMDMQFQQEYEMKNAESEKVISEKISEIEIINSKLNNELRTQLQSQILLNKKWKSETRQVTDRLEHRIKKLRKETVDLKRIKNELEMQLNTSESKCVQYKNTLKNICVEFHDMADMLVC